jgi:hypothetical protein
VNQSGVESHDDRSGAPLVPSLSKDEPLCSSFDQPVLSDMLILRQAQDER